MQRIENKTDSIHNPLILITHFFFVFYIYSVVVVVIIASYASEIPSEFMFSSPSQTVDLSIFDLISNEGRLTRFETTEVLPKLRLSQQLIEEIHSAPNPPPRPRACKIKPMRLKKHYDKECMGISIGTCLVLLSEWIRIIAYQILLLVSDLETII